MAKSALDVWTAPRRTPLQQLAMFMAQSCRQSWPGAVIARADDVWAVLTVLCYLYAVPELKSLSRKALGDLVGMTISLWNISIQMGVWNVKPS
jgi:hypothetical protein